MSRVIGRIFLVAVLAAAAVWGVWTFAIRRPDLQMQLYARSAELRNASARPHAAQPGEFRATACALSPCVLVDAGGQAFLVGAGEGASEGLETNGLMRSDLRAVLLTDLSPRSVEGLPALKGATWRAGRKAALPVFGPEGVERIVTGVNAMLEGAGVGDAASMLAAGVEGEGTVFSDGGVLVSSLPVGDGAGRIFRFDFGGRTLVVAGCGVKAADLASASRGAASAYAILPAVSARMAEIEQAAARAASRTVPAFGEGCAAAEDAAKAVSDAHLAGGMLAPLYPAPRDPAAARAWTVAVAAIQPALVVGAPGALLKIEPNTARLAPVAPAAPAPAAPSPAPAAAPSPSASAPATGEPALAPKTAPTPAPQPSRPAIAAAPSPTSSSPVKPAALTPTKPAATAVPKATPTPAAPRPRHTPSPIASPAAAPSPETPPPSPAATPTAEPMPSPIFPLRDGLPRTDSPLLVGPRLTPSPTATPTPAPTP